MARATSRRRDPSPPVPTGGAPVDGHPSGQPLRFWVAGAAALLLVAMAIFPVRSDDLYMYLQLGKIWSTVGELPKVEPFLFSLRDYRWEVQNEWLSYVAFWKVFDAFGHDGLILFKTAWLLVPVLTVLALYRRASSREFVLASGLLLVAMFAACDRFIERSSIFSDALVPVVTAVLLSAGPGRTRRLFVLPPLFLLWVNLHPGFATGLLVVGVFLADAFFQDLRSRSVDARSYLRALLWAVCGSGLALLLNPEGWRGVVHPFRILSSADMAVYKAHYFEWKPTIEYLALSNVQVVLFVLFTCAAVVAAALAVWSFRLDLGREVLLLALAVVLGWEGIRYVPMSSWLLALVLPKVMGRLRGPWWPQGRRAEAACAGLFLLFTVKVAAYGYSPMSGPRHLGLGEDEAVNPACVSRFMERFGLDKLRIFNQHELGAYFAFRFDGRMKLFYHGFVARPAFYERDYVSVNRSREDFDRVVEEYQLDGFLLSRPAMGRPLPLVFQTLEAEKRWKLVYWDDLYVLYLKDGPRQRAVISEHEFRWADPIDPGRIFSFGPFGEILKELERVASACPSHVQARRVSARLLSRAPPLGAAQSGGTLQPSSPP